MSGFICNHEHEAHKDDNYMALYREKGMGDDNDVVRVNEIKIENEIENVTELGNVNEIRKENVNEVKNETEIGNENVIGNDNDDMDYDSADDIDYSEDGESESESESESDDELNYEDVLYGKEMDEFDDGDLPGSQPTLSATFLENIEEEFVNPDHDGHGEADVDVHNNDSDSDDPTGVAAVNKNKGPQMLTFENSVFDGILNESQTSGNMKKRYGGPYARHDIEFKQRRLSGWVQTVNNDSDGEPHEKDDNSDLDSGDSTSDSDGTIDVNKLTMTCKKKKSSEQFKEMMKWCSLIKRKDV
ncbi:hypothetical protein LIER_14728 [Lithospermum erythrorhizon]|uniref:Uncharacterized protein n=1 Tax=Lithospermum erythrorhizon TaxID=34254 RepID=A0AAV3Q2G6_LITER